jgi:hypothetical protein
MNRIDDIKKMFSLIEEQKRKNPGYSYQIDNIKKSYGLIKEEDETPVQQRNIATSIEKKIEADVKPMEDKQQSYRISGNIITIHGKEKSDLELTNLIDAYLKRELTGIELSDFEQLRKDDPSFDIKVVEYHNLVSSLSDYGSRIKLVSEMNTIHESLDIQAMKNDVAPEAPKYRRLWIKYRVNTAIAATIALIAVAGTLLSSGYFSKSISTNFNLMRREINSIKRSQNALIKNINDNPFKGPSDPGEFGGTGFALSSNGYVVTNFHVIKGADSV